MKPNENGRQRGRLSPSADLVDAGRKSGITLLPGLFCVNNSVDNSDPHTPFQKRDLTRESQVEGCGKGVDYVNSLFAHSLLSLDLNP